MMKHYLKSYLVRGLSLINSFPVRLTGREELDALLKRLYPVSPGMSLIRLGPHGDGGYLIPDDLVGIQACFSPGVSNLSGFEKDCADRGMKVFLADKSVNSPAVEHDLFQFYKKFVGAISNEDFMTLDDWVDAALSEKTSDLLLQMDIEGFEYEVLFSVSTVLMRRFRIIVVELHHLHQLWNKPFFDLASRAIDKILQTHSCVHIHPNNCCPTIKQSEIEIPRVMEFTFLRKDRLKSNSYQAVFPHPLDVDCTDNASLSLPRCWYSSNDMSA